MRTYRIGTRGSHLALIQTQEVVRALETHHPFLKGSIQIVPLKTTGDTIVDRSLTDLGGKSLFTKEIETALLEDKIDLAVHSMKDVTVDIPEGLVIPTLLEREDPRDALISRTGKRFEDLPEETRFGTSSLRRQAFVLHRYPYFHVTSLRGNVPTRLQKVADGIVDATLLAVAGLKRLGLLDQVTQILSLEDYIPAAGQGAIGVQCRTSDQDLLDILNPLNHLPTFQAVIAERAFLKTLGGSCRMPIAAYASLEGDLLKINGMISDPRGQNMRLATHEGKAQDAEKIGREAALRLQEV